MEGKKFENRLKIDWDNLWIHKVLVSVHQKINKCTIVNQVTSLLYSINHLSFSVEAPIKIPKVENTPRELINEYHEKFSEALHNLVQKYKHEYDNTEGKTVLVML